MADATLDPLTPESRTQAKKTDAGRATQRGPARLYAADGNGVELGVEFCNRCRRCS